MRRLNENKNPETRGALMNVEDVEKIGIYSILILLYFLPVIISFFIEPNRMEIAMILSMLPFWAWGWVSALKWASEWKPKKKPK